MRVLPDDSPFLDRQTISTVGQSSNKSGATNPQASVNSLPTDIKLNVGPNEDLFCHATLKAKTPPTQKLSVDFDPNSHPPTLKIQGLTEEEGTTLFSFIQKYPGLLREIAGIIKKYVN